MDWETEQNYLEYMPVYSVSCAAKCDRRFSTKERLPREFIRDRAVGLGWQKVIGAFDNRIEIVMHCPDHIDNSRSLTVEEQLEIIQKPKKKLSV